MIFYVTYIGEKKKSENKEGVYKGREGDKTKYDD
jgi:hypothetical protein